MAREHLATYLNDHLAARAIHQKERAGILRLAAARQALA